MSKFLFGKVSRRRKRAKRFAAMLLVCSLLFMPVFASEIQAATYKNSTANSAPVANDDSYDMQEDGVLQINIADLLGNDIDPDEDSLTVVLASGSDGRPSHGSLTLNSNGEYFTYVPAKDFYGADSFYYYANDGTVNSTNYGIVSITVSAVNDAPVAADDAYSTGTDTALAIESPGVLSNDNDADTGCDGENPNDPDDANLVSVEKVSNPAHGTLMLNADGSFNYTPRSGYHGIDSFTYKAKDAVANSNLATVKITVGDPNTAPVAANDSYSTNKNIALTIAAPGILSNDSDVDDDTIIAVKVSSPAHGELTLNADGSFTYTPTSGYAGADSFMYKSNDGKADSTEATVSIAVVNTAPVAASDSYSTNKNTALSLVKPGVLLNDTDVDTDTLSAIKVSDPVHGMLELNADGSFNYTPAMGYTGPDSFTYKANDGTADSNETTVNITVVNTAPVAASDSYSTNKNTAFTIAAPGILSNDSDVDDDTITAVKVSDPVHGTLALNADGSFTYTPTEGFTGADSFTYKANDGIADSSETTVNIAVNALPDRPSGGGSGGGGGGGGASPVTKLSAPKNVKAAPSENSIGLTWDKVSGAKGYLVYRKDQGGVFAKLMMSALIVNAYGDTDAKAGVTYTYYVVAIDEANNEGNSSNQVTASLSSVLGEKQLNFKDVSGDSWYADYILNLLDKQIITGYPDNTFRPEAHVSRAEFAKMFCLAKGWVKAGVSKAQPVSFSDVNSDDWFKAFVIAAGEHGAITGYPDGSFKGSANITRAEIAAIIARTNGLKAGKSNLADVDGSWAKDSINGCIGAGIIGGYADGTFKPENPATRAEVSKIIAKMISR